MWEPAYFLTGFRSIHVQEEEALSQELLMVDPFKLDDTWTSRHAKIMDVLWSKGMNGGVVGRMWHMRAKLHIGDAFE